MRRPVRRRAKSSPWRGTIRLAIVFAALIAVNVYIFFFRRGTSVHDLVRLSEDRELAATVIPLPARGAPKSAGAASAPRARPDRARSEASGSAGRRATAGTAGASGASGSTGSAGPSAPAALEGDGIEDARIQAGAVGERDTLTTVLRREAVPPGTIDEVATALGRVFDLHTVRAGHRYTLRFDAEDRLRGLEYRTTPATLYRVERTNAAGHETWRARCETAPLDVKVVAVGGTVESTLHDAVRQAGESSQLVAALVDLFAWDVNFYVDTQPGDQFRVLFEKQFLGGRFYRYGRVLAAEYRGAAGTFRAFRWDGRGGAYFDEKGESVEKSLLKTPLKFVRISSPFDRHRFHPILHTEQAQFGVDYAAPVGTPVWATAGGKVTFKGNRGGAECVIIAHPGGMESIYLHLSRYAKGLGVGQTVRQKQVIGYVGTTGLATGPHLHFSLRLGGHFVDPLRLKPARGAPLPAAERAGYLAATAPRLEALTRIDVGPVRREVARGPSPAP